MVVGGAVRRTLSSARPPGQRGRPMLKIVSGGDGNPSEDNHHLAALVHPIIKFLLVGACDSVGQLARADIGHLVARPAADRLFSFCFRRRSGTMGANLYSRRKWIVNGLQSTGLAP